MADRLRSFEAFWPFYLSQHRNPRNRALHIAGTTGLGVCAALAFWSSWGLLGAPVIGYGFAWIGHFFVEHNRPATFTYPLWSLRGDLRMYRLTLLGRMKPELERAERLFPARA